MAQLLMQWGQVQEPASSLRAMIEAFTNASTYAFGLELRTLRTWRWIAVWSGRECIRGDACFAGPGELGGLLACGSKEKLPRHLAVRSLRRDAVAAAALLVAAASLLSPKQMQDHRLIILPLPYSPSAL
jgi:hypothetical protein